jgi:hypothetical protein
MRARIEYSVRNDRVASAAGTAGPQRALELGVWTTVRPRRAQGGAINMGLLEQLPCLVGLRAGCRRHGWGCFADPARRRPIRAIPSLEGDGGRSGRCAERGAPDTAPRHGTSAAPISSCGALRSGDREPRPTGRCGSHRYSPHHAATPESINRGNGQASRPVSRPIRSGRVPARRDQACAAEGRGAGCSRRAPR